MQEKNFEQQIDEWVLNSLQKGVRDFTSLVCSLPGVYPTETFRSLTRIKENRLSHKFGLEWIIYEAKRGIPNCIPIEEETILPLPHPLDYDWRFAESGQNKILDTIFNLSSSLKKLLFLGAPTLGLKASQIGLSSNVVILDKNMQALRTIHGIFPSVIYHHCDITQDTLPFILPADIVFLDPPWYPDIMNSFLWAARYYCALNGHVLLSLPPIGTRPGIKEEQLKLFQYANQLGLQLIKREDGVLPYKTPLFEKNALASENIRLCTNEWRKADLVVFTCLEKNEIPKPLIEKPIQHWGEEIHSKIRIRFKNPYIRKFRDPKMISVFPNDIFPSVSRRDPRRDNVDVWTSSNRVFKCRGAGFLKLIFMGMRLRIDPIDLINDCLSRKLEFTEIEKIKKAVQQSKFLIAAERRQLLTQNEFIRTTN